MTDYLFATFAAHIFFAMTVVVVIGGEYCSVPDTAEEFFEPCGERSTANRYTKGANGRWQVYIDKIDKGVAEYVACDPGKCSCHYQRIKDDLKVFKGGITKDMIDKSEDRGVIYQIIDHQLYRSLNCMFPGRCGGIQYFLLKLVDKLPDMEFVVNTRDYPQSFKNREHLMPVFSFSKTKDYSDITYPAWTFWEGGPAISLYPRGLGRWDKHRKSITEEAEKWPWDKKIRKAFFRGSRTSPERDSLVLLSREAPDLVDAQYTKNQAWKSPADTLHAEPAEVVSLESHCHYKYLFNYRGVAASFRLKHLFLCKSLVFHVGEEYTEFFYDKMIPWVHYIPVEESPTRDRIRELLEFSAENDDLVKDIAERGFEFIQNHLRIKDIFCYWRKLLTSYAKLMNYKPTKRKGMIEIKI